MWEKNKAEILRLTVLNYDDKKRWGRPARTKDAWAETGSGCGRGEEKGKWRSGAAGGRAAKRHGGEPQGEQRRIAVTTAAENCAKNKNTGNRVFILDTLKEL